MLLSDFTTGADFVTYVTQQYQNNTPFKVYSPIPEGQETTIQLPDIQLDKGTNVVKIGTTLNASNMIIKYVK